MYRVAGMIASIRGKKNARISCHNFEANGRPYPGGLYLEGRFHGGFFVFRVWGLIFGGAYTWRGVFSEFDGM